MEIILLEMEDASVFSWNWVNGVPFGFEFEFAFENLVNFKIFFLVLVDVRGNQIKFG